MMTLIFGNLVQDFVNFGNVLGNAQQGNATAIADLPGAASHFRHTAALDATYLVYIGACEYI